MTIQACMGGWCKKRDHCAHYHAEYRHNPSERLCVPGMDGFSDVVPVRITMPSGTWEATTPSQVPDGPYLETSPWAIAP